MRRTVETPISNSSPKYNIIIFIWIFFIIVIMLMFTGCSALGCDCNCETQLNYFAVRGRDLPCGSCLFTDNSLLVFGNIKINDESGEQNYTGINCSSNNGSTYLGCDNETTITDENINIVVCGSITQKSQLGFSYDYNEINSYAIGCVDGCAYLSIDGDDRFGYIIPESYTNDIVEKNLNMMLGRTDCMGNEL